MQYANRTYRTNEQGLRVFTTPADHASEQAVAAMLEQVWRCDLHRYPHFAPVDWYAERDGRLSALVELKTRSHASDRHATVWLNVRKHLALSLGAMHYGVPSLFVVAFTDGVRWIDVSEIDARRPRIGGCSRIVKALTDREPVIDVPVDRMKRVSLVSPSVLGGAFGEDQQGGGW